MRHLRRTRRNRRLASDTPFDCSDREPAGRRGSFGRAESPLLLDYTAGVAADTTSTAINELRQAGVALSGEPVVLA